LTNSSGNPAQNVPFFRLASDFRDNQRSGSLEYMKNHWRRELETPLATPGLNCLIDPIKIFELTVLFFQNEAAESFSNGAASITRCPFRVFGNMSKNIRDSHSE
jgi:hypothetical protein